MKRSNRARGVRLSTTIAIDEKARRMQAEGIKLWGFGAGQPDFPTPPAVAEAGIAAIRAGKTVYTSPQGTLALRQEICRKLERDNGLAYQPDEILVAAGAKQAIYMALATLVDPGDEVLLPAPYWVSYPEMIRLCDGVPQVLSTDESTGFKITPEQLAAAIGPRTVAIILNTPSNPTGIVYTRSELEALDRVVAENGLHLITDEIYERILYDGSEHVSPSAVSPGLRERTAVVNGVSKAYSMTGWRIGYMAAPRDWTEPAVALQSHLSGNACSISQEATVAALQGDDASIREMVAAFTRRRKRVLELLAEGRELRLVPPRGAFYVFPDVSAYYGRSLDGAGRAVRGSQGMAEFLLDTARVAVVPGDAFGSDRHVRISFACSDETIEEGLRSVTAALSRLR